MSEIPVQFKPFIIKNVENWWSTKGHKTCSVCGYNTRNFKYHSYINNDIIKHLLIEHKDVFKGE